MVVLFSMLANEESVFGRWETSCAWACVYEDLCADDKGSVTLHDRPGGRKVFTCLPFPYL